MRKNNKYETYVNKFFIPYISAHNQSWVHIIASKVFGWSLLLWGLINLPLVLNADSDATVDIGMAKISLAIVCKIGYLLEFAFHQANISKSLDLGNTDSSK